MNPHYESDKLREEIDNIYEYLEELTGERHLLEEEMANMDEDEGEYPMDTEEEIEAYRKSVKNDPFWCAMYRHIKLTDKIDSLIVKAQQLQ
ncbi:MAG: hypothetical protein GY714_13195, partial [Desulfobacterales bacterium]|nr:hypothetical protein [Desulfobacterales bacterium]